ncbi:SNF1-interacting protein [Teratosphaeriaceae sp. CCFEE 6253]|nr:SNF1-interacting protein [Teratosphaeriaceae sp. CCFEE 6253]
MTDSDTASPPPVQAAARPLRLVPVTLKEAALDSPTHRAYALHVAEQVDIIERWLDGYVKAAAKLVAEVGTLEHTVNAFLAHSTPPAQVSEAGLDHDYTLLAMRRYGEGAREFWSATLRSTRKYETSVVEPIRAFLHNELRTFKEARRQVEATQKTFDHVVGRYLAQTKTKEASSLREDAFQLHEARKAYLKASLDFCVASPNLRASLDKLLVRIFAEQWREMRASREAGASLFAEWGGEMERVRGWTRDMEGSEKAFRTELLLARRQIEAEAQTMTKPSRELDDYAASTVPYLGTGASNATGLSSRAKPELEERREKQSWLFMKSSVGKPARTVWTRRWFYVKSGIFGWLVLGARSGGVEESDRTGVLLCAVRPAFQEERRFCFEVKTKDTSVVLQAETQQELTEWIRAFEVAKRKALEDPASTESPQLPNVATIDPAFAITPPIAPEFAIKPDAAQTQEDAGGPQGPSTERESTFGPALSRASFDAGSAGQPPPSAARRVLSLERDPGEGSRDHATRIMQKLDLHKRSTTTSPQLSSGPTPSAGGIAGLIAASHNILPVGPGPPAAPVNIDSAKRSLTMLSGMPTSTLAPSTLANPPASTNLSHTAVVVSGERGIGIGQGTDGSGIPSGLMANIWGSSAWGHVNRIGDPSRKRHDGAARLDASPPLPGVAHDDLGIMNGEMVTPISMHPMASDTNLIGAGVRHRKTLSVSTDTPGQLISRARGIQDDADEYPRYYPLPLKAQQAQFRMLFPSIPRSEKVVLVFRATWNPNEHQEFPGRVYATASNIYFYSNHLGLVLITGVSLESVNDVTAAPGRDCDFLYLHLHEAQSDLRRVTIKVFLEPLRLLQRRLNYLVHNANQEEPVTLDGIIRTLTNMEVEQPQRTSSVESWEDVRYDPDSPGTGGGTKATHRLGTAGRRERDVKSTLRIDGFLYDTSAGAAAKTGREFQKFRLPTQAVVYAPQNMQASVARDFTISAKALFHVMFGDKSAVFQLLYCNRWADKVNQSPWEKAESGGHWTREYSSGDKSTPMQDVQAIDIYNDHLCYVVTNSKVPYRMPYAASFTPTTKIVITHTSKSRCKLAIFQTIAWTGSPGSACLRRLVEQQALNALEADALDLTNVAMDQVAKLGHHSKTNRAVEIFGNIGQQSGTVVPQLDTAAIAKLGSAPSSTKAAKLQKPAGLVSMVVDDVLGKCVQFVGWLLDVAIAISKAGFGLLSAHTFLVALLATSALYNSWHEYRDGLLWYRERSAAKFMTRMGLVAAPSTNDTDNVPMYRLWTPSAPAEADEHKTCRSTFTDEVLTTSTSFLNTEQDRASARLSRSRDALARYRHDLLVALRVINRVERDVVDAEYEEHVRAETSRCVKVGSMLARQQGGKTGQAPGSEGEAAKALGEDFALYCESCQHELASLAAA